MFKALVVASASCLLVSQLALADDEKKVATFGKWDVYYSKDIMTDKPSCVARYKGKENAQLTVSSFAVGSLIYPDGYEYRLDDEPSSAMQINGNTGKRIGAIIIDKKSIVDKLISSKRLRIQIVGGKLYQFDISLSGASSAHEKMVELGCDV